MANYTKATDFQAKDSLLTGNPAKIIKGSEINDEFNAIQTAVATKADLASPAFTGTPTATTQPLGNSSTRLATTAFVQAEITANEANVAITGGTIDGVAITGGTISGLATDLAVADGGTGASSFTLNSVVLGNNVGALNGNMVAPGTSGNALVSNGTTWISGTVSTIGVGQTWQNMLASRIKNTNYTNSTGKPIMVSAWLDEGDTNSKLIIDGVTVANVNGDNSSVGNLSGIVPNNSVYQIETTETINGWAELR